MSVEYKVVLTGNNRQVCRRACFGGLNYFGLGDEEFGPMVANDLSRLTDSGRLVREEIIYYPFTYANDVLNQREGFNGQAYLESIINAFPFSRDVCTVMIEPNTKKLAVRVLAGDVPVEKTMMALFLVRNMCAYDSWFNPYHLYLASGYSVQEAIIMVSLFTKYSNMRGSYYQKRHVGEYNFVNPLTFGAQAYENLCNNSELNWIQGSWRTQRKYNREATFRENFINFNGQPRCLIDCLSVENDVLFIHPNNRDDEYNEAEFFQRFNQIFGRQ